MMRMTLFIDFIYVVVFGYVVIVPPITCKEPCLNDQSLISRLAQHVRSTAPGYSIEDDCRMYTSHPSALGGGHEAVYVDRSGNVAETDQSDTKGLAKDITGGSSEHQPIDGLPVRFHTDETTYTNDLFAHAPNDGRTFQQHEMINNGVPKGDTMAYASTPKELTESDADLHLNHMVGEHVDGETRVNDEEHKQEENGFQSHHAERIHQHEEHDGKDHHVFYNYHSSDDHGDDHGGGHHGGGHGHDDHHGGGHHDEGHHGGEHEEESRHGGGHREEGHHGGEHGESHHGGGHEEEGHHGGGHGEGHHGEEHHHYASEEHESSGDDSSETKKKPTTQKDDSKTMKEFGSYTQDGKTQKVEFSEEEINPYHGKNKESDKEEINEKDGKSEKDDKSKDSKNSQNDNYVFLLGKSNKTSLNDENLPKVFKQLVNDAKLLTQKYHGHKGEASDGIESGDTLKLPSKMHQENTKQNNEDSKTNEKNKTEDSKIMGMLTKYIKSKNKQIYPVEKTSSHHNKVDNYDLGDLGDSVISKEKSGEKHEIDRIAQNIINKFTTKSGDLQVPNDVVQKVNERTGDEKKERCCLNPPPPPPPPPPQATPAATPPPQIVVELPQFQLYPPTQATQAPLDAQVDTSDQPSGKQKLQQLMKQKKKLDMLQSQYEQELTSFKEELKTKDSSKEKGDDEDGADLFFPKEMNGCKGSKTFQKLKECIDEAKLVLKEKQAENQNKAKPTTTTSTSSEKEKSKEKPTESAASENENDKHKATGSAATENDNSKAKPTGTVSKPVRYDPETVGNKDDGKLDEKQKAKLKKEKEVEQDSDSQSVDILGKDKKVNEQRKEKEKVKEDEVFKEESGNGDVPEPVQIKTSGKESDDRKKDENNSGASEKNNNDSQKNDTEKLEEEKDEDHKMNKDEKNKAQYQDDIDKDQNSKPIKQNNDQTENNDNETKPNPSSSNSDDPPTPKSEKDKEEIVQQISKLQKALSSYYKTTQSPVVHSTPIVLVHEIRLVKDDVNNEKEAAKLNTNVKHLQKILKDNSKNQPKKCGSFFLKGKLVFDKDCDEKKRSKIRKQKHKKI